VHQPLEVSVHKFMVDAEQVVLELIGAADWPWSRRRFNGGKDREDEEQLKHP
jgi:hypothetical protein